jgi:hypothetical protein
MSWPPRIKHGHAHRGKRSAEHRIWCGIIARCELPSIGKKIWPYYGGRGIKVCKRWRNSFQAFLTDMGSRPSPKHSIERRDRDGDYEPSNCYWATKTQQMRNRSNNHLLTFNGETFTMAEWAERLKINPRTIQSRFLRGWCVERILTTAPFDRGQSRP